MTVKIQLRRDVSSNWVLNNPILEAGEPGLETDTFKIKYGNGSTPWNSLEYASSGTITLEDIENLNSGNIAEVGNLYFTNARSYANVVQIGFAPNSYVNSLVTDQVAEGTTNLYFSNSRAAAAISQGPGVRVFSNGRIQANVISVNQYNGEVFLYTSDVPELSSNLYFTNARVYSNVEEIGYTTNAYLSVALTNKVNTSSFSFNQLYDAANVGLTVDEIAFLATHRIEVDANATSSYRFPTHYGDQDNPNIYVVSGTTVAFNLENAAHPFLVQSNDGSGWSNVTNNNELVFVDLDGTAQVGSAAQGYTTGTLYWNIPFGTSNVYRYICATHPGNMNGNLVIRDLSTDVAAIGGGNVELVAGLTGVVSNAQILSGIVNAGISTSDVTEGSDLYYTDERVYSNVTSIGYASNAYVNTRLDTKANVSDLTSKADVSALVLKANITDLTTANVLETTNLYFTNQRAYSNTSIYVPSLLTNYATKVHVTNEIGNVIAAAPAALDTLNELAAALGDDANFATTTATLIGNSYNHANAAFNAANTKTVAADLTTANVTELTNLYFTNTRAIYALTGGDNLAIDSNGLITAVVTNSDLESLSTNLIPSADEVYNLGSAANRWKDLYLSGNSIVLGNATITSSSTHVVLPSNTKIGSKVVFGEAYPEDFGAVGNGITDDTNALSAAMNSLGSTGGTLFLRPDKKYRVATTIKLPKNITIKGSFSMVGGNGYNWYTDYDAIGSAIYFDSGASFWLTSGCTIDGVFIKYKDIDYEDYTSFAGTALYGAGGNPTGGNLGNIDYSCDDVTIKNCMIIGFNQAIDMKWAQRTRISDINIDCNNGIKIEECYDIPYISRVHCWPFASIASVAQETQDNTGGAALSRPGVGFFFYNTVDWGKITDCFTYGYQRGFYVLNCNSCTLIGCGADDVPEAGRFPPVGSTPKTGAIGFKIDGTSTDTILTNCQSAAHEQGFYISTSSGVQTMLENCVAWANKDFGVLIEAGDVVITDGVIRQSYVGVKVNNNSSKVTVKGTKFTDIDYTAIDYTKNKYTYVAPDVRFGNMSTSNTTISGNVFDLVASTTTTLPHDGDFFQISSGSFVNLRWGWAGRKVTLKFDAYSNVTHTAAATASTVLLNGGVDANLTPGSTITLVSDKIGKWFEVSRSKV